MDNASDFMSVSDVCAATGGILESGNPEIVFSGISTDARTIKPGDLFIALKGARFDGHDFIGDAAGKGAAGVLVSRADDGTLSAIPGSGAAIRVRDTIKALGDLAAWHRRRYRLRVAAVTGSVGKTTTKDFIASVLASRYKVLKSEGNFNNEIGLPLTIFNLDASYNALVVEMGMRGAGEIRRLSEIAKPDVAVITNIGISHIEKLGSMRNILEAKLEISDGMGDGALLLLNGDDPMLSGVECPKGRKMAFYGTREGLEYRAGNIRMSEKGGMVFDVACGKGSYEFYINQPGLHNVYNALAAITLAMEEGFSTEEIASGLDRYAPGKMRLNIIDNARFKIIDDTYNASPQSMKAAMDVLSAMKGSRRIAVLGEMLEMGEWAYDAHKDAGRSAALAGVDILICVGGNSVYISEGAIESGMAADKVFHFNSKSDAIVFLHDLMKDDDIVLVKGSRGTRMEEVVAFLASDPNKETGGSDN